MEKQMTIDMDKVIFQATPEIIYQGLKLYIEKSEQKNNLPDFEADRISKSQAAKLAGISIPTLDKMIKKGKFKQYNLGTRKYFLKSEIIESLRNNS
ncbi:MAG: helix-turn-helix domain-containing protein [Prolixibacteraceae bacterium]|nr:helix-turn-helix domain-containing protein [Prolixibacteraceae bacterium]